METRHTNDPDHERVANALVAVLKGANMSFIDRLDPRGREPEDHSPEGDQEEVPQRKAHEGEDPQISDWREYARSVGALRESTSDAGAAATGPDPTPSSAAGGDAAAPAHVEPLVNSGHPVSALGDEAAAAGANGPSDRPAHEPADPAASRPSRRTTGGNGPRPLKEGLRRGLNEERVWLQAQREELQTELTEKEAQIQAEIADIDTQIGHIDALLGLESGDSAQGPAAEDRPAPLSKGLLQTG